MHPDGKIVPLRSERTEAPPTAPQKLPALETVAPQKPASPMHPRVRWALFAALPLVLVGGGYWHVTGGQVMSTHRSSPFTN
jgi:hypothetical protein